MAVSKMGSGNLAMVFAPAILRCPHDDMVAFQNVAVEMKFAGMYTHIYIKRSLNIGRIIQVVTTTPHLGHLWPTRKVFVTKFE